jgi:hypothetical protein
MHNTESNQNQTKHEEFSFVWDGGFSYLTYLKKKSNVTLTNQKLVINTQNFILGAFPNRLKTTELALTNIKALSTGSRINWFDLVFSVLFVIITLISMKFWPLVLTVIFVLHTFNTNIFITDKFSNRIIIPTNSKNSATQFVQKIAHVTNQFSETASSVEQAAQPPITQTLLPTREGTKMKKVFLFASAAVVALVILVVAIQSRGGFDNKYVESVKDGTLEMYPQATVGKAFDKYFTSVVWKHKKIEGTDFVTFSGYSSGNDLVEIKFRITDDNNHFLFEEGIVNGETNDDALLSTMESVFAADTPNQVAASTDDGTPPSEPANAASTTESDGLKPSEQSSSKQDVANNDITLMNFLIWYPSDPDKQLSLNLDGEKTTILVGNDTPNGIKLSVIDSLKQDWRLELPLQSSSSLFDEFGDLHSGFSIFLKDHDFNGDGTPELVVVASNQLDESFIWVFSYNFVASENGTTPLELIWSEVGQSDLSLEGNKITLPFGSQGLFNEYVYSNGTFQKK